MNQTRLLNETFVKRVERHAVIGSTNDRAKELAAGPLEELPVLIVADRQTAGRGRGKNTWWTGDGSLAFSLLVDLDALGIERPRQSVVALAAGIATAEAVAAELPGRTVGIHWPNDIYAAGRKLAGILIESPRPGLQIVGIGINTNTSVAQAPIELQTTATSLIDLSGRSHDHTEILIGLLNCLANQIERLRTEPAAVAARADALCLQHGCLLTLDQGDRQFAGVCRGIAPDGGLLLDLADGRRVFYSGVVVRTESG